jgi:hypothetical protein
VADFSDLCIHISHSTVTLPPQLPTLLSSFRQLTQAQRHMYWYCWVQRGKCTLFSVVFLMRTFTCRSTFLYVRKVSSERKKTSVGLLTFNTLWWGLLLFCYGLYRPHVGHLFGVITLYRQRSSSHL